MTGAGLRGLAGDGFGPVGHRVQVGMQMKSGEIPALSRNGNAVARPSKDERTLSPVKLRAEANHVALEDLGMV